jgi:integrase
MPLSRYRTRTPFYRNIIDGSFRALFRDARLEIEELQGKNPFIDVQWPRLPKKRPDPFTAEERDRIITWYIKNDFFYYPLVAWQFQTGMRPSETFGLTWQDIDLEAKILSINKSRVMGITAATKTANSERVIPLDDALIGILKLLPSLELGLEHVFVGKRGEPMSKKWAEHFWSKQLKKAGVRHRKFYSTRHTAITQLVRAGENLKAIADFMGTSVAMIEANYCARQGLNIKKSSNCCTVDGLNTEKDWLRGRDLNPGPQGYEPCELPDCSTPRQR